MIDWAKVKEEIGSPYGYIKFELDGHVITVSHLTLQKGLTQKGRITVYIDGQIKGMWDEENMPIIKKVWCTESKPLFSKQDADEYRKKFGKKSFDKCELFKKFHTTTTWQFKSLAKFIKQYKELEKNGLKLAKGFEEFEEEKKQGLFDE